MADDTSTDYLAGEIQKNSRESIRVGLTNFKGHDLAFARVFAEHRETGEMTPTKSGVTFRVDRLAELIAVLQKAQAEAQRRGLATELADE
ncbi:MAG: PC4/YdbC family ssDNA-binding protein [Proteobacteria bacterium]|nr:PC4/YdbC family ssDNA-binding protein [Pseudomonadota bacterium]